MLNIGRLSADHDTYVDENEKEVSLIEIHIKLKGKDDDFPVCFLIKRAQSKINIDCGLVFRKFNRINKKILSVTDMMLRIVFEPTVIDVCGLCRNTLLLILKSKKKMWKKNRCLMIYATTTRLHL